MRIGTAWLWVAVVGVSLTGACVRAQPAPPPKPPTAPKPVQATKVQTVDGDVLTVREGKIDTNDFKFVAIPRSGTWVTEVRPGGKTEKGTYLGLATTRVTPVLRSNLRLQPGVGLVVEQVVEESPAAAGGLKKYDILQKFNDQLLVNPQQLGALVRLSKPGDEVTLTVLRGGEEVPVKVKLEERDVLAMDESAGAPWGDAVDAGFPGMGRLFLDSKVDGSAKRAIEMIRQRHDVSSTAAFTYADPEHTLEITRKDGVRNLVAKDKAGKLLFHGPIDTEKQREAMPPDIQRKLKVVDERMKATGVSDDGRARVRMVRPGEVPAEAQADKEGKEAATE